MLTDLNLTNKSVLIIGGGEVAERKATKIIGECSKIIVASKDFTHSLKQFQENKGIELVRIHFKDDYKPLDELINRADIVIVATDDNKKNGYIANRVKRMGRLVCAVDNPTQSDFSFPAVASFGGIQVAIFTGGRSPTMAKILRERIEKLITEDDLHQIELQQYSRKLAKSKISDADTRKSILYKIAKDKEVNRLIKKGLFGEAKIVAEKIIERA